VSILNEVTHLVEKLELYLCISGTAVVGLHIFVDIAQRLSLFRRERLHERLLQLLDEPFPQLLLLPLPQRYMRACKSAMDFGSSWRFFNKTPPS
jgi:hypothetical protein